MKKQLLFKVKQAFKMFLQNVLLPCVYWFWNLIYYKEEKRLIICADSHHKELPFSLQRMYDTLLKKGYPVTTDICDYNKLSAVGSALRAIRFMKTYAQARVVFICDSFLPVVSCKKDPRTTVVQLMHSCGLGKKIGYDAKDDVPANYRGHVYRNYDLVTVTSENCIAPIANAMHHTPQVVRAIGSSRTDFYYDEVWIQQCKEDFYAAHPDAKGKTVVLWAPTFRGNAADPKQIGTEEIDALERSLGNDYFVVRKVHPHMDSQYHLSNCAILTERLLPVADVLITDYSSIVTDFMFFQKPYVLFAPDWEQYKRERGMYINFYALSPYLVIDSSILSDTVLQALRESCADYVAANREFHLSACDGQSTERIIEFIGL